MRTPSGSLASRDAQKWVANPVLVSAWQEAVLAAPMDVEDLARLGQRRGACPYYAARAAMPEADLVLLPYAALLNQVGPPGESFRPVESQILGRCRSGLYHMRSPCQAAAQAACTSFCSCGLFQTASSMHLSTTNTTILNTYCIVSCSSAGLLCMHSTLLSEAEDAHVAGKLAETCPST